LGTATKWACSIIPADLVWSDTNLPKISHLLASIVQRTESDLKRLAQPLPWLAAPGGHPFVPLPAAVGIESAAASSATLLQSSILICSCSLTMVESPSGSPSERAPLATEKMCSSRTFIVKGNLDYACLHANRNCQVLRLKEWYEHGQCVQPRQDLVA